MAASSLQGDSSFAIYLSECQTTSLMTRSRTRAVACKALDLQADATSPENPPDKIGDSGNETPSQAPPNNKKTFSNGLLKKSEKKSKAKPSRTVAEPKRKSRFAPPSPVVAPTSKATSQPGKNTYEKKTQSSEPAPLQSPVDSFWEKEQPTEPSTADAFHADQSHSPETIRTFSRRDKSHNKQSDKQNSTPQNKSVAVVGVPHQEEEEEEDICIDDYDQSKQNNGDENRVRKSRRNRSNMTTRAKTRGKRSHPEQQKDQDEVVGREIYVVSKRAKTKLDSKVTAPSAFLPPTAEKDTENAENRPHNPNPQGDKGARGGRGRKKKNTKKGITRPVDAVATPTSVDVPDMEKQQGIEVQRSPELRDNHNYMPVEDDQVTPMEVPDIIPSDAAINFSGPPNDNSTPTEDKVSPSAYARHWITTALQNPRSTQAQSCALRNSLKTSADFIASNIEKTITEQENNSLLIFGARGSGKTLAVERALSVIHSKYNAVRDASDPLVGTVRLYGWAHWDERIAFKEIARQLCSTFRLQFSKTASLGDNIEFLRDVLNGLARAHKVAVFVLEDFDVFARRSKQTLLYCLLDALQTSGVQAVVVGTTVRHDCMDLLEKRVKSRFSHRTVMVYPPRGLHTVLSDSNNPNSPLLTARSPGSVLLEEQAKEGALEALKLMLTIPVECCADTHRKYVQNHNRTVESALEQSNVVKALEKYVFSRNSLHDLRNVVMRTLAESADTCIRPDAIIKACEKISSSIDQGIEACVSGLSILELAVLVAAHRASRRSSADSINFEMAYKEFSLYSASGDHVDNYTKSAAAKAFYKLTELGLVCPTTGKADARAIPGNNFAPMTVQVTALELRAGIDMHQNCPSRLRDWAAREGGPTTTAAALL